MRIMADLGAVNLYNIDLYDDGPFTEEELLNIVSNRNPNLIDLSLDNPNVDQVITNHQINTDYPEHPNIDQTIINHQISVDIRESMVFVNNNTSSNNYEEDIHDGNNINPPDVIGDATLPELLPEKCELNTVYGPFNDDILALYEDSSGNCNNNNNNMGDVCTGDNFGGNNRLEGTNNWQINVSNYEIGESSMARPAVEEPFVCDCCEILRELIHTNGEDIMRLEIHGRIGYVCHTILVIQPNAAYSEEHQYQVTFLKDRSLEESNEFLENYCEERVDAGFIMVQDELASFYKTMSIGSDTDETIADVIHFDETNNLSFQPQPQPQPDHQPQPPPLLLPPPESVASASMSATTDVPINAARPEQRESSNSKKKTPLALQRERAGKMTLIDFEKYFHLPILEAARKMNICPTVVKKICRRGGLARWPYRKIRSSERKISSWKSFLRMAKNLEDKTRAEAEMQRLMNEIDSIRAKAVKKLLDNVDE